MQPFKALCLCSIFLHQFQCLPHFSSNNIRKIQKDNQGENATTSSPSVNPESQEKAGGCLGQALTARLWIEMGMDDHLRHYPGGVNISLPAFANDVGATNFQCGIGNSCDPSQSCLGMEKKEWFALASAHRFNTFANQLYEATAYALSIISDLTPSMVSDLVPNAGIFWADAAAYVGVLAATITGTPAVLFGSGRVLWITLMSAMYLGSGAAWWMENLEVPDPMKFNRWGEVAYRLQEFEAHMQASLTNFTQKTIEAAISSDTGLYGISKSGNLFEETRTRTESEVQAELEETLKMRSLSHILRIQNVFITRGSESCNGDGPGGSRNGSGQLSYCGDDGIMMNIIRAGKDNSEKLVHNAPLILSKYGLSTQLLTQTAWECQKKYGVFRHETVVNM
ncbi:hypothetical protein O181_044400 [Austropuccinia psidii MF-1]|uniref:DUF7872 domain-containing protein n=1 Tax=Austropuccinia psidii MF-1 TaxID=1389203 RepID=A0A9Q3HK46_9BASI|nr:hypothetical protein [Austropuccinia psidii MF-1]